MVGLASATLASTTFAADPAKSLYDRPGGKPALSAVVGELWAQGSVFEKTEISCALQADAPQIDLPDVANKLNLFNF